ncbi:hypothetical protein [Cellulomonas soli]
MPIFELDEGKVRLVQPMQPLAGSFAQECAALLAGHLAAIAGEPLFTVRSRASVPEHTDAPDLLALDASGRPVVFDVAQVIDDDALVTAMRRAGQAGRMTVTDLARAYHVDPGRFGIDYAAFREQVSSGPQTSRREGVRLVLLCSEVAAEASDSLAFLRGPGRHVEVFQVGVVRGSTTGAWSTSRRSPCTRACVARSSPRPCGSCDPARRSPARWPTTRTTCAPRRVRRRPPTQPAHR